MQTGYFSAAWNDIKNSPGWFGKLAILALVSLIPVFGWIVVYGYFFGWAREIAWNVHTPLPEHVFDNADGKLYSRGFFAMVITFVCTIIPITISTVWDIAINVGLLNADHAPVGLLLAAGLFSIVIPLLMMVLSIIAGIFAWVGIMRMSVYGRLAPGLQFRKIWAMIRHDPNGLLRILGMSFLLSFVLGTVLIILLTFVTLVVALIASLVVGVGFASGNLSSEGVLPGSVPVVLFFAVTLTIVLFAVCGALTMALSVFVEAMVSRALGYWTRQFDVPAWRGQDDPMPFELVSGTFGSHPPAGRQ